MTMTETACGGVAGHTRYEAEAGAFLAGYTAALLRSGATCMRLERNVDRMAAAWHLDCTVTIMPRHIHLSVTDAKGHTDTFITATGCHRVSYALITSLSKLSWQVADSHLSLAQARRAYDRALEAPDANPWWTLIAVSCANSAFCRLFGGDYMAMAVVFVATLAGYYMKQLLLGYRADIRLTFIVCAAVSAILASGDRLFALGTTPDVAIATSVLYLVPGIPFLNAFSDLIAGHYICFVCRTTNALVLTASLSLGLCIGMKLMNVGMF